MTKNHNVLKDMQCPKCGSQEPFYIASNVQLKVFDDGTEEYHDVYWEDDSSCVCHECRYTGIVSDFYTETNQ